uniref:SUEL-type lectin domain-containing protein n=1 Tax=Oryzias melastigma TaxID=30732 RepID=A0A3B3D9U8_ORYME
MFASCVSVVAVGCVLGHAGLYLHSCSSSIFFRLSSCFMTAAPGMPSERVTTCVDGVVHRLSCELSGVISVQTSRYGAEDSAACNDGRKAEISNATCSDVAVVDIVKKKCNGKRVCELSSSDLGVSGGCRGTTKYLHTTYTCLSAFHHVTCEHSLAHLQCGEEQVILVYRAEYGRRDHTTCIHGRPDSQIQNINCLNPTSKVAERCDGKNSCLIKAGNSEFGDPCYGTYKYLEVAYTCSCT